MTQLTQPSDDGTFAFFCVVTPGFEKLAVQEMALWAPGISTIAEYGGVSFRAPLVEGCELNRVLKIPTRILLRLTSFGCRDFPKLFKKTAGFDWSDWIVGDVELQASSHKSRLFIKKRIEETCRDGFLKYFETRGSDADSASAPGAVGFEQQVLVRIEEDVCTFSLDTSGDFLYKRGRKVLSAEAPLRETIAAALLTWMAVEQPAGDVALIDPMAGSGTFAIEAASLYSIGDRDYAFARFPRYRREAEKSKSFRFREPSAPPVRFKNFIGFDIDAKAARTAEENWKSLRDPRSFAIQNEDIFEARPLALGYESRRWLICNPPYGERLKVQGGLKNFYEKLFEASERVAKPDLACFVLPETARPQSLNIPKDWKRVSTLRFKNGGLPVQAVLLSR